VADTVDFFEQHGIAGKEKTLGQLFPRDGKAGDVVAVFHRQMQEYGQEMRLNCKAVSVEQGDDGLFTVGYEDGNSGNIRYVRSRAVVLASGGLPVAKLGASDFALRVARQFDLEVVPTAPALVPLTITGKDEAWFAALAGNSVYCRAFNEHISFVEIILFTHWGLSGPAILQISSYWRPGETITIDLLPGHSIAHHVAQERSNGGRRLVAQL